MDMFGYLHFFLSLYPFCLFPSCLLHLLCIISLQGLQLLLCKKKKKMEKEKKGLNIYVHASFELQGFILLAYNGINVCIHEGSRVSGGPPLHASENLDKNGDS